MSDYFDSWTRFYRRFGMAFCLMALTLTGARAADDDEFPPAVLRHMKLPAGREKARSRNSRSTLQGTDEARQRKVVQASFEEQAAVVSPDEADASRKVPRVEPLLPRVDYLPNESKSSPDRAELPPIISPNESQSRSSDSARPKKRVPIPNKPPRVIENPYMERGLAPIVNPFGTKSRPEDPPLRKDSTIRESPDEPKVEDAEFPPIVTPDAARRDKLDRYPLSTGPTRSHLNEPSPPSRDEPVTAPSDKAPSDKAPSDKESSRRGNQSLAPIRNPAEARVPGRRESREAQVPLTISPDGSSRRARTSSERQDTQSGNDERSADNRNSDHASSEEGKSEEGSPTSPIEALLNGRSETPPKRLVPIVQLGKSERRTKVRLDARPTSQEPSAIDDSGEPRANLAPIVSSETAREIAKIPDERSEDDSSVVENLAPIVDSQTARGIPEVGEEPRFDDSAVENLAPIVSSKLGHNKPDNKPELRDAPPADDAAVVENLAPIVSPNTHHNKPDNKPELPDASPADDAAVVENLAPIVSSNKDHNKPDNKPELPAAPLADDSAVVEKLAPIVSSKTERGKPEMRAAPRNSPRTDGSAGAENLAPKKRATAENSAAEERSATASSRRPKNSGDLEKQTVVNPPRLLRDKSKKGVPAQTGESDSGPSTALTAESTRRTPNREATPAARTPRPVKPSESKIAANGESGPVDSETRLGQFQGIRPGRTSLSVVREALGKPVRESREKQRLRFEYVIEPLERIVIEGQDDIVESITMEISESAASQEILNQLAIKNFDAVDTRNEQGVIDGQLIPERGIRLHYVPGGRTVRSVVLERVSAAAFLERAQWGNRSSYDKQLHDLETAERLSDNEPRVHWLRAELLAKCGRSADALSSSSEAIRLSPGTPAYELTHARLLGDAGQYTRAIQLLRELEASSGLTDETRAAATCLLGTLTAKGPKPDAAEALKLHQRSIEQASRLVNSKQAGARRLAKQVLLEAYVEVAAEIAAGTYRNKNDVVGKWVSNAERIAQDLVANEKEPAVVNLATSRRALAIYVAMGQGELAARYTDEVLQQGRTLLADTADQGMIQHLTWEIGESLCHAVAGALQRGAGEEAVRMSENALGLLDGSVERQAMTPALENVRGRLYFAIGSVHAIAKNDHGEAVRWFEKACVSLPVETDVSIMEMAPHGERLVTMGTSYWQSGQQERGMRLTKQGAQLLQRAVKNGTTEEKKLSVPYSNLAFMHKQLGNDDESKSFASMAARVESKGSRIR